MNHLFFSPRAARRALCRELGVSFVPEPNAAQPILLNRKVRRTAAAVVRRSASPHAAALVMIGQLKWHPAVALNAGALAARGAL